MADVDFGQQLDDDNLRSSCLLTVGKSILVFGGRRFGKQVSQILNGLIQRIGSLPMYFEGGKCIIGNEKIFLCFGHTEDESRLCRMRFHTKYHYLNNACLFSENLDFDGKETETTFFSHYEGEIVQYGGRHLAIGGGIDELNGTQSFQTVIEVLDGSAWQLAGNMTPITHIDGTLVQFATLNVNQNLFIFGMSFVIQTIACKL